MGRDLEDVDPTPSTSICLAAHHHPTHLPQGALCGGDAGLDRPRGGDLANRPIPDIRPLTEAALEDLESALERVGNC